MKNKLLILLLLCLMSLPTFATSNYDIMLNDIHYNSTYPLVLNDDVPYLSLIDFADLTLSKISNDSANTYTLTYGLTNYTLEPNKQRITSRNEFFDLGYQAKLIDNIMYVPYTLLDVIEYPYTLDPSSMILSISSITPYSRNSDNPNNHVFLEKTTYNLMNLPIHISLLSSKDLTWQFIEQGIISKDYIAFIDNSYAAPITNRLLEKTETSPYSNIEVLFRPLYSHGEKLYVYPYESLSVTPSVNKNELTLQIGTDTIITPSIWATFLSSHSLTELTLDKSVDMTIMYALYTYYRDLYYLKDDIYFNPLVSLSSTRTTTFTQQVYATRYEDGHFIDIPYELVISRVHELGTIKFIIDIFKI